MERKYYLRGLGIGIVMTAIIMGIALSGSGKMTDEEIIKRARELGMVEDTYLVDTGTNEEQMGQNIEDGEPEGTTQSAGDEPEPESPQTVEDTIPQTVEPAEEPLPVVEPVEEETDEADIKSENSQSLPEAKPEEDTNEMTRQDDTKPSSVKLEKVTIVSGDGSYTVALKLKEAGVVTSAETFDTFLCEKGYDKKLRTGTFQIPADASDEQIARIITGQE